MQTKTIPPLFLSPQVRMLCSIILTLVTATATLFYHPFVCLAAFFSVQILVKMATFPETSVVPFTESLIAGPLKVLVSVLMIGIGLPTLDSGAGLAWIGVAILFLFSGMQNMYWIYCSGRLNFSTSFNNVAPMSARQQMKAEREENDLLADLASVFSTGDGKEEEVK